MPSWTSVTRWYGPATSAVTYGESGAVVAKRVTCAPPGPSRRLSTRPFETTCQSYGAVTVSENGALRSGWSKQVYIRFASAVSNCE